MTFSADSNDSNPAVEKQHAAAPLSKAPTYLTASDLTAPTTLISDGDSSTDSSTVPHSPLHVRRRPQHYAAATSITGCARACFSDISSRYSINFSRVVLGTGTGTTVYECEDLVTREKYAVKTVAKRGAKTRDLNREVSLLRDLREKAREVCPWRAGRCGGVIELVDLHEDAFNLHIVTELCVGGSLFDRIHDRVAEYRRLRAQHWVAPRCFSEDDASAVLRQVLSALDFLHSHDICHRNVKPENILFVHPEGTTGPDGENMGLTVRLVDLGSARYHHASSFEPRMSTIVGTCTFIAPEVLRRQYDRRCDHWSLGVVSYVMMCGYPPFVGGTHDEVCDAVRRGRYRFGPKHWVDVSKEAKGFVRGLLQVNVKSRMGGEEAMEHPFITGGTRDEGGGEGSGSIRRSISRLSLRRSISRLSLTSFVSGEESVEDSKEDQTAVNMPRFIEL